ncbi:AfsR/SARP family transcriptional regulator [Actinomycetospora termitidis]|uniref:AfsR/SARP family transcriptional regulator n=1 Tax=Actinomycetospora termitidis TaxID=3053470 RepID=A0ABT7M7X6_9PSEU|nr:AfsR/SARP family transcriptional regulator [Actinomycetospora sp. Odt1-22]MDL5156788.1 AfsR/SARP family transcriptional regulator [Actinomycetospora sp. Odt1-22]
MSIRSVRVLGPIDAVDADGAAVALGGPKHRAVLARLAVARGRTVPLETLIDDLWPDGSLPARPAGALRTFVAALRTALEPDRAARTPPRLLVTRGPGYALEAPVDAARFEELLDDDPAAALALWRGPAYADLPRAPWAEGERARLTALRLDAVERLARRRMDGGRPEEAVADLDAHTTEHPWREEGWRLLALALYRARREGDALAVLRRARARLADELGLDPGVGLAQLETHVLQRSPALDLPSSGDLWTSVAGLGRRAALESTTPLLRTLAVHGGGPVTALRRHTAAVQEARRLGDRDLTARLLGAFDVPSVWTRSDDPASSAVLVDAAEWCLRSGSPGRVTRARLLATVAVETRGLPGRRGPEAAATAESLAREIGEPAILRHALAARVVQSFHRPGSAPERVALGEEIVGLAVRGEDPTSEILGHLVLLQARSGLGETDAADGHAAVLDRLGERSDSPGVGVLLEWYRADSEDAYRAADRTLAGAGMPGLHDGLLALALAGMRLRRGEPLGELPDAGPYAPWIEAYLHASGQQCGHADAGRHDRTTYDLPDPPPGHVADALWVLAGHAGLAAGDRDLVDRAVAALTPAAGEIAGAGSGLLTFGPVAMWLRQVSTNPCWDTE